MACSGCLSFCSPKPARSPSSRPALPAAKPAAFRPSPPADESALRATFGLSICLDHAPKWCSSLGFRRRATPRRRPIVQATGKPEPLKVMISGAPASGKGTQCEMIKEKYGLVHVAAGDLLRAEVAAGTENGSKAKEYMEKGMLVPDEIVVGMVKERLLQPDVEENGWLLDGYPRSLSQATALENLNIHPDIFILLEVDEETLVERVVGRRLDPVTGRIYHLKYSPPENEEIAARLTQRFDDTEEKVVQSHLHQCLCSPYREVGVKLRLNTHHQNVEAVLGIYKEVIVKINGNLPKEDVFGHIDAALTQALEQKTTTAGECVAASMCA